VRPQVGAEVDEIADVLPRSLAQRGIRCGDVQALRADHKPVQADELEAFTGHNVAILPALVRGDRGRRLGEGKGGNLDPGLTGFADSFAGIGKGPLIEGLVAGGMANDVRHETNSVAQRVRTAADAAAGSRIATELQV